MSAKVHLCWMNAQTRVQLCVRDIQEQELMSEDMGFTMRTFSNQLGSIKQSIKSCQETYTCVEGLVFLQSTSAHSHGAISLVFQRLIFGLSTGLQPSVPGFGLYFWALAHQWWARAQSLAWFRPRDQEDTPLFSRTPELHEGGAALGVGVQSNRGEFGSSECTSREEGVVLEFWVESVAVRRERRNIWTPCSRRSDLTNITTK